ncbi:MAG: hypothetical protein FJZ16_00855 [Candidatus Omnitrophica bacterium]|nr:hypothetical protein [Candidatus Omnitrophota bacterium]
MVEKPRRPLDCSLIESAKKNQLCIEDIREKTETVEEILEHRKESLSIIRCRDCGQFFVDYFREQLTPWFEDEYWQLWIPIGQDEIENCKAGKVEYIKELVKTRYFLRTHPVGEPYFPIEILWEKGNEILLGSLFSF